jgi:hypothetical protein
LLAERLLKTTLETLGIRGKVLAPFRFLAVCPVPRKD